MAGERGAPLFQRIAVATDGSETAMSAVAAAIDLALRYSSDLLVIAVAPLPQLLPVTEGPLVRRPTVAESPAPRYRALVDTTVAQARSAGVSNVSGVCEEGVVVDEVLEQLRLHGSDLLVVGSRGLSAAKRLLLGSVSTGLVTHAPCPVLVVRGATPPAPRDRGR